jgi:hypothetical protein
MPINDAPDLNSIGWLPGEVLVIRCIKNQMVLDECWSCGKGFVWIVGCGPWCLCPYCGMMGNRSLEDVHKLMEKTNAAPRQAT